MNEPFLSHRFNLAMEVYIKETDPHETKMLSIVLDNSTDDMDVDVNTYEINIRYWCF